MSFMHFNFLRYVQLPNNCLVSWGHPNNGLPRSRACWVSFVFSSNWRCWANLEFCPCPTALSLPRLTLFLCKSLTVFPDHISELYLMSTRIKTEALMNQNYPEPITGCLLCILQDCDWEWMFCCLDLLTGLCACKQPVSLSHLSWLIVQCG